MKKYFNVHLLDSRSKGTELSKNTANNLQKCVAIDTMVQGYRGSQEEIWIHKLLVTEGCNNFLSWRQDQLAAHFCPQFTSKIMDATCKKKRIMDA
jgi:sarcosine oxidase delta subunit